MLGPINKIICSIIDLELYPIFAIYSFHQRWILLLHKLTVNSYTHFSPFCRSSSSSTIYILFSCYRPVSEGGAANLGLEPHPTRYTQLSPLPAGAAPAPLYIYIFCSAAIDRGVRVELLISVWNHTRPAILSCLHSQQEQLQLHYIYSVQLL